MDGAEGKRWRKRISWARCREPFKTELNTLATHWIEGALSHEELALELWKHFAKCQERAEHNQVNPMLDLTDVAVDLRILVNAILADDFSRTKTTPDSRRAWLDACCAEIRTSEFKLEP